MRQHGARQFIRTNPSTPPAFAQPIKVDPQAALGKRAGQTALIPALFEIVEEGTDFPKTMKFAVDAMFGFIPDLQKRNCLLVAKHRFELFGRLDLSGRFTCKKKDSRDRSRSELVQSKLESESRFPESGRRFEKSYFPFVKSSFEIWPNRFLSSSQRREGRLKSKFAQPLQMLPPALNKFVNSFKLCVKIGRRLV